MYKEFLKNKTNIYFGDGKDTHYLTKYESSNLHLFLIDQKYYALTDQRYFQDASKKITIGEVLDYGKKESWDKIKDLLNNSPNKELYINENEITITKLRNLKKAFKDIKLIGADDFYKIRIVKDEKDIENIKEAAKLTDQIFTDLLNIIKPGMSENEIKSIIRTKIVNSKGNLESFDPIVAFGKNSSSPHWKASDTIIENNSFLTIDMGQFFNNMASDMTRTIFIGKEISEKQEEVYNVVLEAQRLGIAAVKEGVRASDIDKIVRDYIDSKGYGKYFNHGTGHGLGFEVHEYPYISTGSDIILKENMIITIEPGIYIENEFGIRIEDDLVVKKDGFEILNSSPKELIKI